MFVIPMAGLSSRFFKAGYNVPKYQLKIGDKSVFQLSLESFKAYFETDLFVIILRDVFDTKNFVTQELQKMGIQNFVISTLEQETAGQAETVYLGLKNVAINKDEPLYIFNIDTFRYDFKKPSFVNECAGYLEVFKGEGDHWSFIEINDDNQVSRTTEKERISDLCSDGLYYFREIGGFFSLFERTKAENLYIKGELYIAPMYNLLIDSGKTVLFDEISLSQIDFCGTPQEYEFLLKNGLKN